MVKVFGTKSEPELFLQLIQDGERVKLILVDICGCKHGAGNVLDIDENGLTLHSSITTKAPFKLNRHKEIFNRDKDC